MRAVGKRIIVDDFVGRNIGNFDMRRNRFAPRHILDVERHAPCATQIHRQFAVRIATEAQFMLFGIIAIGSDIDDDLCHIERSEPIGTIDRSLCTHQRFAREVRNGDLRVRNRLFRSRIDD